MKTRTTLMHSCLVTVINYKKKVIKTIAAYCLLTIFASCGPTIYKSTNFESSRKTIKTLAVLSFDVSMDTKKLPKGVTVETLKESLKETGFAMQNAAYTWLLQRENNYTATIQDVDKTNAILKKANISYDDIALQDKGELCKLLSVDGIISGKATLSKPMSEGAAVTVGLLSGAWVSTNKTAATLTIHNGSGELLWKYDYETSGSVGSSSANLTNALMKNASKKFPYTNQ